MDEPIPKELRLGGIMDEKERSFINKIEELEKQNRALQKEVNSLQGFLTKSVGENTKLQKQVDYLLEQSDKLEKKKNRAEIYKFLFLCMVKGLEGSD